jgi:hypothetical protein
MKRLAGLITVTAIALCASFAFGAARSDAGLIGSLLTCPGYTYSQPFTAWGDGDSYFMMPGGSFDGGSSWSLSGGAKVVSGNEPFYLNSRTDSHSLYLPAGSSATSPATCLAALSLNFRLVGKASDGSGVHVDVYSSGLLGLVRLPVAMNIDLSSQWDASGKISLLLQNVLALTNVGKTSLYFKFSPIGSASVQLDDVYVDPCLHEG